MSNRECEKDPMSGGQGWDGGREAWWCIVQSVGNETVGVRLYYMTCWRDSDVWGCKVETFTAGIYMPILMILLSKEFLSFTKRLCVIFEIIFDRWYEIQPNTSSGVFAAAEQHSFRPKRLRLKMSAEDVKNHWNLNGTTNLWLRIFLAYLASTYLEDKQVKVEISIHPFNTYSYHFTNCTNKQNTNIFSCQENRASGLV